MTTNVYYRQGLTGGGSTDLDAVDGDLLNDGDAAIVYANGLFRPYLLDADSGLAEASPGIIAPDTNAGNKRWILQSTALSLNYNSISTSADGATGQVDAGNHFDVAADTGVITRTLKTADIATAGNRWRFKLTDNSNKLTIDTEGSETIGVDGDSSIVLGIQGQVVELLSDGTNVQIVQLYPLNHVLIVDEKADGTDGGGSSAGDNTRVLNTEKQDSGDNATLASNQVTLNAGTYRVVDVSAPAFRSDANAVKLVNATDSTDVAYGTSTYSGASNNFAVVRSYVRPGTVFTVADSKALEVEHYIQDAQASNGLGIGVSNGDVETFTVFAVERIQ